MQLVEEGVAVAVVVGISNRELKDMRVQVELPSDLAEALHLK